MIQPIAESLLESLGRRYGADKLEHGYLPRYAERFDALRGTFIRLFEIGVMDGASLRMWRDYFHDGEIYGLDINPSTMFEENRIKTFCGDQSDGALLSKIVEQVGCFDIVIDDGSHHAADHLATFNILWQHTKLWYVIEDCQSLFDQCWTAKGEKTVLDVIRERTTDILVGGILFRKCIWWGETGVMVLYF